MVFTLLATATPLVGFVVGLLSLALFFSDLVGGLSQALSRAGIWGYVAIAASAGVALGNAVFLFIIARGKKLPPAVPLMLAMTPWLLGTFGTMNGVHVMVEAVLNISHAD